MIWSHTGKIPVPVSCQKTFLIGDTSDILITVRIHFIIVVTITVKIRCCFRRAVAANFLPRIFRIVARLFFPGYLIGVDIWAENTLLNRPVILSMIIQILGVLKTAVSRWNSLQPLKWYVSPALAADAIGAVRNRMQSCIDILQFIFRMFIQRDILFALKHLSSHITGVIIIIG